MQVNIDNTIFMRIQLPLMILFNVGFFLFILFKMPDWVFGIPKLYPPFPEVTPDLVNQATNAIEGTVRSMTAKPRDIQKV
jgi:hypothetical protein